MIKCVSIVSDNVHDMTNSLYPTSTEAQINKWTKHVKHTFDVLSENECAAHAALCQDGIIEFYVYKELQCQLGDLSHTTTGKIWKIIPT